MSLTSMLKGKSERDIQFQNILKKIINPRPIFITYSGKKAFSSEYEIQVPYLLNNSYEASLVGTAFDYLARFMVAKHIRDEDDKESVFTNLVAKHGLERLEGMTEKKIYKELNRKYEKGIKLSKNFIYNKKSDFDELLNFVGYLAVLESVGRTGMPPMDINKSLMDDTRIEIINDLESLCSVFENKFINSVLLKDDNEVKFNPRFGMTGALCCGGSDADIFINGTLYDFKCTKKFGYTWIECAQILGYYLLNIIDIRCGGRGMGLNKLGNTYKIDKISFYRGRYGEIESLNINSLDENKVEQGIEELRKMWNLKFL